MNVVSILAVAVVVACSDGEDGAGGRQRHRVSGNVGAGLAVDVGTELGPRLEPRAHGGANQLHHHRRPSRIDLEHRRAARIGSVRMYRPSSRRFVAGSVKVLVDDTICSDDGGLRDSNRTWMLSNRRLLIRAEKVAADQLPQRCRDIVPVSNLVRGQQHHADVGANPGVKQKVPRSCPGSHGVVDETARCRTDVG